MLILVGTLLLAGGLAMSARAQSNVVYAVEYNQSTNRFGTINLLNGSFTKISSIGSALINDVAYCPTNGMLYGISNSTALVTFNQTNGTMTRVTNLSVSGIQSLAFRPKDGVLFGASQSALYSINPATGKATSVGSYGSPKNLSNKGQNIRFAQDGNLYVSNTSTNTDIYRINTTNGAATWMGEATGYPYLMLQNASSNMYGVYINLGSSTNPAPKLVTFNLNSFVNGGTNANGTTNQIIPILVGAGTNFPANFNFSGNIPQAVTNLTVPVSATGPSNQTAVAGGNVVFNTVASGTGPYTYAWLKNGTAMSGKTNSSLTLNNVTTNDAATYSVIVGGIIGTVTNSATLTVNVPVIITVPPVNQTTVVGGSATFSVTATGTSLSYQWLFNGSVVGASDSLTLNNVTAAQAGIYTVIVSGAAGNSATNSATLTVNKAAATVALGGLNQTYSGSAKVATATTVPSGLTVNFTYNGSANAPTNAGSYTVVGTINDANYQGSATGTLVIGQATASITLGSLSQTYSGSPEAATATTTPNGLAVSFTYNGSATVPTAAGSYTVVGTINNANYQGSATGTLVIGQATASITLGSLSQTYSGSPEVATATTVPSGLTVNFTYNGSATVPTAAGSYTVVGTINDANYQGSATGTLAIGQATGSVALGSLNQTYSGSATAATATTVPSGLTVNFTYNGSAAAPTNAGSYTVVATINNANYLGSATNTLVISKATGSITLGSLNQTYSGSSEAATATTVPSGLTVNFTYNGSATIPTAAGSYTVVGTINDANYLGSVTNTLVISKATLTITAKANTKTYDGNTSASSIPTVTGLQGSDTVTGLAEIYDTKNAGAGKTVSVSAYTVNDNNGGNNYTVSTVTSAAGVISPAALTITAVANTKTYDGNTSATAVPTVSGLQGSDTVTGLVESYDTKNVGTGKTLSVSAYTVNDGNSGNNYTVNAVTGTAGVINKAALTITAAANTKTYDGNTGATAVPTVSGLQGSDTVTGLVESYDTKNVGTGKTLSANAYTINDGNNGDNYTVSTATSAAGVINPAALTITAAANIKAYDGNTSASAIPTVSGLQGSDTVMGLTENYDTKNVGTNKTLSVGSYIVNDGNSGNNYTVNTVSTAQLINPADNNSNPGGIITPATLTITADNKTKICGQANPPLTASYTGFVGGENAGVLSSPAELSTTAATTSGAGQYPITVSGAVDDNYTIQYVSGVLQVISTPQLAGANITVGGLKQFVVNCPTISGQTYQLEYTTNLMAPQWTVVGTPFAGTDGIVAVTNNIGSTPQCFFRVQVQAQ